MFRCFWLAYDFLYNSTLPWQQKNYYQTALSNDVFPVAQPLRVYQQTLNTQNFNLPHPFLFFRQNYYIKYNTQQSCFLQKPMQKPREILPVKIRFISHFSFPVFLCHFLQCCLASLPSSFHSVFGLFEETTHRVRRRRLDVSAESYKQRGAPTHKCLQN